MCRAECSLSPKDETCPTLQGQPAWPQVKEGQVRLEKIHLPLCRCPPLPPLKCQLSGWLRAGAQEAPESGSKGFLFFFGVQKLRPTPAGEQRRGKGSLRPARECAARRGAPAVPRVRRAGPLAHCGSIPT